MSAAAEAFDVVIVGGGAIGCAVAAFLLNIVVTRLIALQREQIAALKAFGYRNMAVGLHYLELVLAIAFIPVVGLGAFAGTLAIGLHSVGTLGKLSSEAVEGVMRGPVEAAEAIKLMKPKMVIPMHFGTFPALSGSPEELKKLLPKSTNTKIVALEPGEVLG